MLAAWQALTTFDPSRGVPLPAFLHHRILAAVWTRYRQEWSFGSRARPDDDLGFVNRLAFSLPDPDPLEHMTHPLEQLTEPDRLLIHQLFWDGRSIAELARAAGVSQDQLRARKSQALRKLRVYLERRAPEA
jgi:DNA-directed RNA polymerase specialized sigma24 family protein